MKKAYRVKIGIHTEGGKVYQKGETVISERDLCKLFQQKFDDLGPVREEPVAEVKPPEKTEPLPPTKPAAPKAKGARVKPGSDDFD